MMIDGKPSRMMALALGLLAGVSTLQGVEDQEQAPRVIATTTLVGDVVRAIGGAALDVEVLMPPDTDPHTFQAVPADAVRLANADAVFINGAGLERFIEPLLENAALQDKIVDVSEGVLLRQAEAAPDHDHAHTEHDHGLYDPHVWMDPLNVVIWVRNIERELERLQPAEAERFAQRSNAYIARLKDLDAWIQETVARIPPAQRLLVSDHDQFGYFCARYGFKTTGTVLPGFSTLAEASARDIAALEDTIRATQAPAIFISDMANPRLAERLAEDTGIRLIPVRIGALSKADGPAATYPAMMHATVAALADALAPKAAQPPPLAPQE